MNATTPLVRSITQGSGANALNFAYTYDNRGNITSETRNGVTTTYEYDALGQLNRVNDYLKLISKKKKNYSYTDVCALLE